MTAEHDIPFAGRLMTQVALGARTRGLDRSTG